MLGLLEREDVVTSRRSICRWEYDTVDETLREARHKMEITGNVMHLKLAQSGRWSVAYDMSRRYKPFHRLLHESIDEGSCRPELGG